MIPIEELLYEQESATLDFKRQQYKFSSANEIQKSELLKDILAFANAWRRTDAYILIGVEEVKGGRSKPIGIDGQDEIDDAQLQEFVHGKTQRTLNFSYRTVSFEGVKLGLITIPVQQRPLYIKSDYGKVKRNIVYFRRGSSTAEATPDDVIKMSGADTAEEIPDLKFEFADIQRKEIIGRKLEIFPMVLDKNHVEPIPDYFEERVTDRWNISLPEMGRVNRNYYRQLFEFYDKRYRSSPLGFSLKNNSKLTIHGLKIELLITKNDESFSLVFPDDTLDEPNTRSDYLQLIASLPRNNARRDLRKKLKIEELGDFFHVEMIFDKVQAKQTVFSDMNVILIANNSFDINAEVKIYADNLSEPIHSSLDISCNVKNEQKSLDDIEVIHYENLVNELNK